jgi:hypothetical protein
MCYEPFFAAAIGGNCRELAKIGSSWQGIGKDWRRTGWNWRPLAGIGRDWRKLARACLVSGGDD